MENCPKNKKFTIVSLNMLDDKLKLRLYEIGFFVGSQIQVLNVSRLKQTLLVQVLDSCFAIKSNIASLIEVADE